MSFTAIAIPPDDLDAIKDEVAKRGWSFRIDLSRADNPYWEIKGGGGWIYRSCFGHCPPWAIVMHDLLARVIPTLDKWTAKG